MNGTTLLLAAHGNGDHSLANQRVTFLARCMEERYDFDKVEAIFNQGRPQFSEALNLIKTSSVVVVPLMTSAGYFTKEVLPRHFTGATSEPCPTIRITQPLGMVSDIEKLVLRHVLDALENTGIDPYDADFLIIGHGTQRNKSSSRRTCELVQAISSCVSLNTATAVFLDEPPLIHDTLRDRGERNLVVFPFLFGGGAHVLRDIPHALGIETLSQVNSTPLHFKFRNNDAILLPPLGWLPGIETLIADTVRHELKQAKTVAT